MEERIKKIIDYIERYDEYAKFEPIIDYYQIFNLPKEIDIKALEKEIKQLKRMFHPDQLAYIPDNLKSSYTNLSNIILEIENIFSDQEKKNKYDDELDNYKKEEAKKEGLVSATNIVHFNEAVIENIFKYGFAFTFKAINQIINLNKFNGFTREDDVRKTVKEIGKDKILIIISNYSKIDKNNTQESIINYFKWLLEYDKRLLTKYNIFINCCNETLIKYNKNQTYYAIKDMLETGNVNRFTNTYNYRFNMKNSITKEEPLIFMYIYFCILDDNNLYDEYEKLFNLGQSDLIKTFVLDLESRLENKTINKNK